MNDSYLRNRKFSLLPTFPATDLDSRPEIGAVAGSAGPQPQPKLGLLPSIMFVVSYLVFTATGLVCVVLPPSTSSEVDAIPVPDNTTCFRASRSADHLFVEMNIGSPGRRINALVRFDAAVNETSLPLRVFESQLTQSDTLVCDSDSAVCTDVVMAEDPTHVQGFRRHVTRFRYSSEGAERGVSKMYLHAEAELTLRRGSEYWLTSSHLCVRPLSSLSPASSASSNANTLLGTVDVSGTGGLHVDAHDVGKVDLLEHSFVHNVTTTLRCDLGPNSVQFLPLASYAEPLYLSLSDPSLHSDIEALEQRRRVVEAGSDCASSITSDPEFEQAVHQYKLDCTGMNACASSPSIAFRRVSAMNLYLRVEAHPSPKFEVRLERNEVLHALPSLSDSSGAVLLGIGKLVLIIVAASLVWVRADRATSKPHWMYRHCLKLIRSAAHPDPNSTSWSLIEDGVLGLCCIGVRFTIAYWRLSDSLSDDGQARVCVFEIVCSAVSFTHWIFRYVVIEPNVYQMIQGTQDENGPLTRLGGSTALLDVTGSVLLAFSSPPTLVSTIRRFDPTARVIICALLVLVALPRALFATCCCSVLLEADLSPPRDALKSPNCVYMALLAISAAFWCAQSAGLGVLLVDLVITPFSILIMRGVTGSSIWVRTCLFLGALNFGIPRLLMHATSLKKGDS